MPIRSRKCTVTAVTSRQAATLKRRRFSFLAGPLMKCRMGESFLLCFQGRKIRNHFRRWFVFVWKFIAPLAGP